MSILKHILVVVLVAALATIWIPHDVFLSFHQHEHTSHNQPASEIQFENQHHHCFQIQLSLLHQILPGFILGFLFIRFLEIKAPLFYTKDFIQLVNNELVRGPPESSCFT